MFISCVCVIINTLPNIFNAFWILTIKIKRQQILLYYSSDWWSCHSKLSSMSTSCFQIIINALPKILYLMFYEIWFVFGFPLPTNPTKWKQTMKNLIVFELLICWVSNIIQQLFRSIIDKIICNKIQSSDFKSPCFYYIKEKLFVIK